MSQDLSVFQREGFQSAPSFRLIGSQILRQQLFKVFKYIQFCKTVIINPGDPQTRVSGDVPWVTAAKIRASDEHISSFLGATSELS